MPKYGVRRVAYSDKRVDEFGVTIRQKSRLRTPGEEERTTANKRFKVSRSVRHRGRKPTSKPLFAPCPFQERCRSVPKSRCKGISHSIGLRQARALVVAML